MWRTKSFWLAVAVALAIPLTFAAMAVKARTAARHVEDSIAALEGAGLPTTYDALGEWYPETPETHSAYVQALNELDLTRYEGLKDLPVLGTAEVPALGEKLPQDLADRCRAFLARKANAILILKSAAQLGTCRFPIDLSQGMQIELPHLVALQALVRVLQLDGIVAAEDGMRAHATGAVVASCGVSHALKNEPLLISQLVRLSLMSTSIHTLERILSLTALGPEDLARLGEALSNLEDQAMMYRALVGERCSAIMEFPNMKWLPLARSLDQAHFLDSMEEMLELAIAPYTHRAEAASRTPKKKSGLLASLRPLSAILMPSFNRADEALLRTEALRRCALTALAIEGYRNTEGHLPEGLDALGADLPGDLFAADAPLRFKPLDKGYVVYSVGLKSQDAAAPSVEPGDLAFTVLR